MSRDSFESAGTARAEYLQPNQSHLSMAETTDTHDTHFTDARSNTPGGLEEDAYAHTGQTAPSVAERDAVLNPHSGLDSVAQAASLAFASNSVQRPMPAAEDIAAEPRTEDLDATIRVPNSGKLDASAPTGDKGTKEVQTGSNDKLAKELKKSSRSSSSEGKSVEDKVEFDPYAHFTPAERKILEDQAAVPPLRKVTMGELFRFQTKWEKAFNAAGLLCAIVSGAAQPLMTVVFGSLTTSFTSYFAMVLNGSSPEVLARAKADVTAQTNKNALYLLYIGIGIAVTTYIYEWAFTTSAEKTAKRVRESYYASVMRQNVAYFDKLGAGEVATRIETDCHLVQDGVGDKIPISMSFVSMFFSGFIIAFVRNWLLAIALSCIIPVIGGAGFLMNHFETKLRRQMLDEVSKGGSLAEEVISSIRTVFAFGNQQRLVAKYDVANAKVQKMGIKTAIGHSAGLGVFFFVIYAVYALAFQFGTTLFLSGRATSGEIVNVFFAIMIGAFSLAQLPPNLEAISLALGAASKLFDTIDRVPVIDSASNAGEKPTITGQINLDNVVFYYPARPSVKVLDNVSISFNQGETTALVGASGAGKSSIIGIVERFYDVLAGDVRIDGLDIKTLNVKHLRRSIGYVQQEPQLFSGSIRSNIAMGLIGSQYEHADADVRAKLVEDASRKANAHSFITSLPDGYETRIGERGALLSGGQRQRIAIARAIIKNPPILLLDEATSALDTESERLVQAAIDEVSVGRTTIVVAHRLSTIRDAHKIVVMGEGRVLEEGSHHDLLANIDGPYYRLVNAQKIKEDTTQDHLEDDRDEKTLLKQEADKTQAAATGKLERSVTNVSASSQVLGQKTDNKAKELGGIAVAIRLGRYAGSLKTTYAVGIVAAFVSGCVYPCFGIVFGYVLQIYSSPDRSYIRSKGNFYALLLFIIAIVSTVAILAQGYAFGRAAEVMSRKLRARTLATILQQDVQFFDEEKNSSGSLTSQVADHAQSINPMVGSTAGVIVQNVFTLIAGCIIGLVFLPKLAAVGIAVIPFSLAAGITRLYFVVLSEKNQKTAHQESAQLATEGTAAIRTVASLTREDDALRIYSEKLDQAAAYTFKTAIYSNALYSISQGLSYWVIGLTFWYGSRLLINDNIPVRDFFIATIAVVFASIQVGQIFNFVPSISGSLNAARTLIELFDHKTYLDPNKIAGKEHGIDGLIRFENVHFRYPTRQHVPVLRGLNIEVKPGQFVALCGQSGCGKSTVISLLERYYDPLVGSIMIDGERLTDLNLKGFRSQVALVAQESQLYDGTIRENVLLGSPRTPEEVSEEEIWQACREANIATFIQSLPDGLDTDLGGKGTQVSGGQRSRICLARALIRKPKLLLLDEATSALDSESEKVVQEALDKAAKGRSTLAVAHRLSTIQNADMIYVLKEGRVAESGTHNQLMAKRALYYELVHQQSLA